MEKVSRRKFIQTAGVSGLALWLGLSAKGTTVKAADLASAKNFTPYIMVEGNGNITIYNIKPEMGQGTFQSVPALIAEEFEVSLDKVIIKNSNGEKELGPGQRAGGSASIRTGYTNFRKIGASAKEVFILAAAGRWGVDANTCYAENAMVIHSPSKRSIAYENLIEDAAKIEIPKEPKLKDPKDFKIIGKAVHRPDVPLKTNGSAQFGIDASLPGMVYATVERCPVIGGTLKSFDATEALKVAGVEKVFAAERIAGTYKSTGVAVIANSYWAAMQGRAKLKIEWETHGYDNFNSKDYEAHLRALANEEGLVDKNIGAVDWAKVSRTNTVEAFYETPIVAHSPLEPMGAVVKIDGDAIEIWTSTQVPSSLTGSGPTDLHSFIGFKPENIKMHNMFIGGGFGRRLYLDYIIEAVNVAKQLDKPVKVVWSREDTTKQGPFRPMTFSKLKAGFDDQGKLSMFEHKVISPSLSEATRPNFDPSKVDASMVEGIAEQAYEIPNIKTSYVRAECHLPLAAWRSVTSSTLSFAHECFIDELAVKAKQDPLDFRLNLLSKPSDTKKVLLKLKEVSGWDKPLPKGKGRGIAQWEFFAGLCGQVVEVTHRADGTIKIDKVYAVIDLGEVVSPDNVKNQVEGAIVMAITAATKPAITFKMGEVEQSNFYDNNMLRMNETPKIEVHILADGGKVKGVGEPGLPPFAPALANAIYAATGKRVRKMPFELKA
ncbi:xanthine dehydrogenase family protein molybdopterin-binding subunit [Mucilaginibacter ginkgonis]|uniref:Xanthine dehydrogenase family protein molybdopterin-binding subunit n=1 Tax=Mucilaginibacter ginkgonis TaxID=2682091 RepID=A0A6I4I2E6_9SPHI|nr:molybdopterin cofactor-binding domain-containing protein [Mucilaginibacter ginkgonis]QQL48937.1 xanthine dehydrogenase family protein molybdopterin-binding subunit [Mucilaginibacter ginkgonis]